MSTAYCVTHRTEYAYESEVSDSYGQVHLIPRELAGQRCRTATIDVDPAPESYHERVDFFGNRAGFFSIHTAHRRLVVTATSTVEVEDRADALSLFGHRSWERIRDRVRGARGAPRAEAVQYTLDSPLVKRSDTLERYAARAFAPGRPLVEAVAALCSQIHSEFEYRPGSTSVTTPLEQVYEQRRGVCQDFAQIGIGCLRSLGLPARYVSGYLETDPPPGAEKLLGTDGSHAWLSVLVPDAGWLDVDPTNDQFANGRYIVCAYGRDYADVPPLNGVIYTNGATNSPRVSVDVVRDPLAPVREASR
jgi:transglutaminase-like putative cysteine protease